MSGILPDGSNGGLPYRTVGGVCSIPANVLNAYCPAATFTSSCDLTAIPSDCTGRITAAQINAIVSEMIALAECFNPDGAWNCASLTNLCSNFTAYRTGTGANTLEADVWRIACAATQIVPGALTKVLVCQSGVLNYITSLPVVADETSITGTGLTGSELAILPVGTVAKICASAPARNALIACIISTDVGNKIGVGTDFKLYSDCLCLPRILPAVPGVAAPANGASAYYMDDSDPDNIIEYFWDGTIWNRVGRPDWVLFGVKKGANTPVINGVAAGTTLMVTEDFIIPNNSPWPINVHIHYSIHMPINWSSPFQPNPAPGGLTSVTVNAALFGGPGGTGASLGSTHNLISQDTTNSAYFDQQESGANAIVLIPPGGRTVSFGGIIQSAVAQPSITFASATPQVSWYGSYAERSN